MTVEASKDKQILYNLFAYVLAWSAFCVTYNQVLLKIGSIGGTLYFNLGVLSILEFSASFIGSFIQEKYQKNLGDVIRYIMTFLAVFSGCFIFYPIKIGPDFPFIGSLLLFLAIAITKISSDIVNNLIGLYAPKIFTIQFVSLFLAYSRLSSRLILYNVPLINIYLEERGIHCFLFMSVVWFICALLAMNVKMIKGDAVHAQALVKRRTSSKNLNVSVDDHEDHEDHHDNNGNANEKKNI